MKVRIGNDIRLHVTLLGDRDTDWINIKSIRAYLVNVTKQHDIDEQHRHDSINYIDEIERRNGVVKYVSRFPAEPRNYHYASTPYDLMHCGHPSFYARPVFGIAPYTGFGVYPHTFDPFTNHLYAYDDASDLHNKILYKELEYKKQYEMCEYLAPVLSSEYPNKVYVDFPAERQLYTGTYKLIIVAKLYQPGYSSTNLRTVTMDYNNVFTLVSTSEDGESGNVYLMVGNSINPTGLTLQGTSAVTPSFIGRIDATVTPTDIDDKRVHFEVDRGMASDGSNITQNLSDYLIILERGEDFCTFIATLAALNGTFVIKATAAKGRGTGLEVSREFVVRVVESILQDDFVNSAEFNKTTGDITLSRISGASVNVEDFAPEVTWHTIGSANEYLP